jgi:hypothetical protein
MMATISFSGCGVCHDVKLLLADILLVTGVNRISVLVYGQ